MLHPHTELRPVNPEVGFGVFATRPIPRGTITWVQDKLDQVIDLKAAPWFAAYPDSLERYSFRNRDGHYVLCWDISRFINHSCDANCLSPGTDFEIALRDIEAGEQITNDYGSLNLEFTMRCCCGAPNCREVTTPEDFHKLAPTWDARLRKAFPDMDKVEQPLWKWISSPDEVNRCLADLSRMRSILHHHFSPDAVPAVDPRVQSVVS